MKNLRVQDQQNTVRKLIQLKSILLEDTLALLLEPILQISKPLLNSLVL